MTIETLTPDRLRALQAMQGTRGILPGIVAKACVNGSLYVDVLADAPALAEADSYKNEDGAFALAKLFNAVKSTIDRKRVQTLADGHTWPNVEAVRDDDAGTVYVVNWDNSDAE